MIVLLWFIACSGLVAQSEAAKILALVPVPSRSHTVTSSVLLKELARRGHEVTLITMFPTGEVVPSYREIRWDYKLDVENAFSYWTDPKISAFYKWGHILTHLSDLIERMHNSPNLQAFLSRNETYDICIVDLAFSDSMLGICHYVNGTPIAFSTNAMSPYLAHASGNPKPYAYVPHLFLPFTSNMNFLQRVANTMVWLFSDIYMEFSYKPIHTDIVKRYYPRAPPLEEMMDNVDIYLINSNYALDTLFPLLPNVIPIGGFHMYETLEMSSDLKQFLDDSVNGVIYFNLGCNAKGKNIDKQTLAHILKTFAKLPYDILWKFEDDLPDKPANVRVEKWLPQRSILMHSNVKIFMTHGGQGGTIEAVYGGVPMICLPLVGDQLKNCAENVANGFAVLLDMANLDQTKLTRAIYEIVNNPKYKESIMRTSDIYRNQPINPMDKAVFWIEHVVKHKGAKHLKSPASNIAWYQYMLLDVVHFLLSLLIVILALVYVVFKLFYYTVKLITRKCAQKLKKN